MSTSDTNLIRTLQVATFWINRIIPPLQIVFGTFGNLCNIIIFTRPNLRTNPCANYFLASSINNMLILYIALLTFYFGSSWNLVISVTHTVVCKIRSFFVFSSLCLSLWYTMLATIDRFFSSSENVHLRQMSNLRTSRKVILFSTIFIYLIHIHILIFYYVSIRGNVMVCNYFSSEYNVFSNFFILITSTFLPITLTSIFSILMITNVRKIHNRVGPQANNVRNERMRSSDRQMAIMVLFQVLVTILITAPFSTLNTYRIITVIILKTPNSALEQAIITFTLNIFLYFYYSNPVVGFYVYTLTGSKFRFELKRCSRYGFKYVLTATGLIKYLPLRTQQVLLGQNEMDSNNGSRALRRVNNAVYSLQRKKSRNMTSIV